MCSSRTPSYWTGISQPGELDELRPPRRGRRRAGAPQGARRRLRRGHGSPRLPTPPPGGPGRRGASGPRDRARGRPPRPPCGRGESTATIAPRIPRCAVQRRTRSRRKSRCADRGVVRRARAGSGRSSGSGAGAGCRARRGSAGSCRSAGRRAPSGVSWRKENAGGYQGRAPPSSSAKRTSRRPESTSSPSVGSGAARSSTARAPSRPVRRRPASISAGGTYGSKTTRSTRPGAQSSEAADDSSSWSNGSAPSSHSGGRGRSPRRRAGRRRQPGRRAGRPCAGRAGRRLGHLVAGHALGAEVGPTRPVAGSRTPACTSSSRARMPASSWRAMPWRWLAKSHPGSSAAA